VWSKGHDPRPEALLLEGATIIELTHGDLLHAHVDALVNAVNSVGYMGKGIALQFKQAFPRNNAFYERACQAGQVALGRMLIFDNGGLVKPHYIINFPTKRHWRGKSKIEDIAAGLKALVADVKRLGIRSMAVPPLGCGLGGLDWRVVRPLIEAAFAALPDVRVLPYEPRADAPPRETEIPMTAGGHGRLVTGGKRRPVDVGSQ
jgi:O-acetyl-ADP-ribose deacetylase (regulator of RNase III)